MPTVSIILPTRDRAALWPRALKSVLAQTWTDLEVVLVDNNRRDPPLRAQAAMAASLTDPRVRVVEGKDVGTAAAARNAGLANATGAWISYLDDDDVYRPGKVEAQLRLAEEAASPLVLCGYTVNLPRRRRTRQVHRDRFVGDELLTDANWGTPMLFHRRDPSARFDESLRAGEDEVFAHAFLARAGVLTVPNRAESLVDVYPQIDGPRVHRGTTIWSAYRRNLMQVQTRFSRDARRRYIVMGRLVRAQAGHGDAAHFSRCALAVLRVRGLASWRLVANASVHRLGWFSDWAVS